MRAWMGMDDAQFYDKARVAIVPMAFCFPGYGPKGADLPPPPDLNAMEAELKEKEMDDGSTGGGAGGKRKKTKASGGSLEMGSLGGFGGSLDDVAPKKKKTKACRSNRLVACGLWRCSWNGSAYL